MNDTQLPFWSLRHQFRLIFEWSTLKKIQQQKTITSNHATTSRCTYPSPSALPRPELVQFNRFLVEVEERKLPNCVASTNSDFSTTLHYSTSFFSTFSTSPKDRCFVCVPQHTKRKIKMCQENGKCGAFSFALFVVDVVVVVVIVTVTIIVVVAVVVVGSFFARSLFVSFFLFNKVR